MPGSLRLYPSFAGATVELVQTHALCRTHTPSATPVSISSPVLGLDPEELGEPLEQCQVALQDRDHALLQGEGRGQGGRVR